MVQALKKGALCLRAVRLDTQCAGGHRPLRDPGHAVGFDILDQLVKVVFPLGPVQAPDIFVTGQQNQSLLRPGCGHIDQLPVFFQPIIGLLTRPVRNAQ